MATLRELKSRLGSVASSEKITGAMKMISSAKMHKAEGSLRRLVPFRSCIQGIIGDLLTSDAQVTSQLVETRPLRRMLVVVWGSDDGLCGAYNVNIYKKLIETLSALRSENPDAAFDIMPIGKKMLKTLGKLKLANVKTVSTPEGIDSKTDGNDINNFMLELQKLYVDGTYDSIRALYMSFISAGRQRPVDTEILPLRPESLLGDDHKASGRPCLFEPDPNAIFNSVLPLYLMAKMADIFTQNRASEQAARVMAMQSANDNAKTLLEQLQLEYNKLRQQSITNELLDIVGGQVRD